MVTPSPHQALPVGDMIEEFRIVRVLGAGSFGIVYECRNTYLPETAAIKEFLPPELAYRGADGRVTPLSDRTEETFAWARDRFLQEAKTLWELARPVGHPNIVRVTRYCEANGTAYMFMELEQGRPMSDVLAEQGRLSPQELDTLFYPLLDGLERIHAADVLHRDIKPANILLRADGSPVLIDFGAARRAVPGGERSIVSAYTPVYAALEQYHDVGDQGPWTDIYSFGATLYQAVTGRKPLSASERLCGEAQIPAVDDCRGSYPLPILVAIDRALEIKPEDRPQSVSQWRNSLELSPAASGADDETVVMPTFGPNDPTRLASPTRVSELPPPVYATASDVVPKPVPQEHRGHGPRIRIAALLTIFILISLGIVLFYRDRLLPPPAPGLPQPEHRGSVPEDMTEHRPAPGAPDLGDGAHDSVAPEAPESTIEKPSELGPSKSVSDIPPSEPPVEVSDEVEDDKGPPIEPKKPPEPTPVAGTRFSDSLAIGGSGPIMVWLPGGEFQMGSPPEEAGRNPDERLHLATVPQPFAVGETEIALGHYRRFIEDTGYRAQTGSARPCLKPDESWQQLVEDWSLSWESPGYPVTDRHPVTCVSWSDARAYAKWLSEQTGHPYRLPTELEWEYAARAGTSSSRFWGNDPQMGCRYANTAECEDNHTHAAPAGTFPPNPFGLREMLGNLAEWTCSEYGIGYGGDEGACSDGSRAAPRVFRGGSWLDAPELVRSAARDGAPASLRLNSVGFRLVRTLPPESDSEETDKEQVGKRP